MGTAVMNIISVVGARPNFMKIAPFVRAIASHNAECDAGGAIGHLLVHTGQHYDDRMSRTFFEQLGIPDADINLGVGSGTHSEQIGRTMIEFEKVIVSRRPDWVVVVGDVNATCACSIVAKKEQVRLAHIEAGLRSGDMAMPEEINRLVTDRLSDLLFTPDRISDDNLHAEGVSECRIKRVGNIMIDTLEHERARAEKIELSDVIRRNQLQPSSESIDLASGEIAVVTLHRPSNVDRREVLAPIVAFLTQEVARDMPVIWPIHPRTHKQMETFGLSESLRCSKGLILLHPVGYHDMLRLNMAAKVMLTDSGGLQEESCVLGTPCLTMRHNTERPITLREHGGASTLVGDDIERIRTEYRMALRTGRCPKRPELWDGHTAVRIVRHLIAER